MDSNTQQVNNIKQYIITDPCYIMDEKQYDKICLEESCDFEGQAFPLKSIKCDVGGNEEIVFLKIEGTPHGDGGCTYKGQDIGVDAGMLCIAFSENGWEEQESGATFKTFREAEEAFPKILKHF
jgi:hypothetical protein